MNNPKIESMKSELQENIKDKDKLQNNYHKTIRFK